AYYTHDYERAIVFLEKSVAVTRSRWDRIHTQIALRGLAQAHHALGNNDRAAELAGEALRVARESGDRLSIAFVLEVLSRVANTRGDLAQAVQLIASAQALRVEIGVPLAPAYRADREQNIQALRTKLGEQGFARLWTVGEALSLEKAIAAAEQIVAAVPARSETKSSPDFCPGIAIPSPNPCRRYRPSD